WRDPLMALGAPLLDRDHAVEAFSAFLAWVGERRSLGAGLVLHTTPRAGPAAAAIRRATQLRDARFLEFDGGARATAHAHANLDHMISRQRRRTLGRLRRRLAERGELTTRVIAGAAVEDEMEAFFELEASGWKGRRGTALASSIRTLALARGFIRGLAREGRCKIARLDLDGAPVAAAVLVYAGETAFYWKMAFDERYAAYSPGAQLMVELSRTMLAEPDFALMDSCAEPGAQVVESIWKGRRRMADFLVGGPGLGFTVAGEIEGARRGLRAGAKKVYRSLAGRLDR
ncbi:MAG: GNAT family N-acetyltransferase, partial [Rhodoblastus sp.]